MAKMWYNLEEVQEKLGKTADEIKDLVSNNELREFRDGAKLMYKVEEVDQLSDQFSSPDDAVTLPPDDEFMADGSSIGLAPLEDSVDDFGLNVEESAAPIEDSFAGLSNTGTGTGFDVSPGGSGSGSIGLSPMDDTSADQIDLDGSQSFDSQTEDNKDDTVITSHGVNVLDDSDDDFADLDADPMAQTQIAPDFADQVQLDSGSSGSGLLDLTREADDTSLGAELLDEIYPGADEGAVETQVPTGLDIPSRTSSAIAQEVPDEQPLAYAQFTEVIDPTSGAWGAMLVVPFLLLVCLAFTTAAAISNVQTGLLKFLGDYNLIVMGAGAALALIVLGIGVVVTKPNSGAPKPKKVKAKKPKKEKKSKKK